ncbi:MAG: NAD(P)H-dependent oxidoreductase [Pseudoclavibacter sp.]|nr:NAD(P)H-dependent oxidoreductase [Pseudoclavibacter sp.]
MKAHSQDRGSEPDGSGRVRDRGRRIMILAGSHRTGAYSTALARAVAERLVAEGREVDLVELAGLDLPMHDPIDHRDPEASADPRVRTFARRVREAGSFVWISPVYHGSYSSGFKNAIDNVNISLMQGKPVAVMVHGGGRFSGSALDHLRAVGVNLHARVLNVGVVTNTSDFTQTEAGPQLTSEAIHARLERVVDELLESEERTTG